MKVYAPVGEETFDDIQMTEEALGEFHGYSPCGLVCFGFARALCMASSQAFVAAFSCQRSHCPRLLSASATQGCELGWPRPEATGDAASRERRRGDLAG